MLRGDLRGGARTHDAGAGPITVLAPYRRAGNGAYAA
jgi:hypothetical protein